MCITLNTLAIQLRKSPYSAWVLRAFVIGGFTHDWPSALRWYEAAIDVIERGRKLWKKVRKKDRGVVFDNAFFLAVRGLHMEAFFQVCDFL